VLRTLLFRSKLKKIQSKQSLLTQQIATTLVMMSIGCWRAAQAGATAMMSYSVGRLMKRRR
jgi:hypothetical protein